MYSDFVKWKVHGHVCKIKLVKTVLFEDVLVITAGENNFQSES